MSQTKTDTFFSSPKDRDQGFIFLQREKKKAVLKMMFGWSILQGH